MFDAQTLFASLIAGAEGQAQQGALEPEPAGRAFRQAFVAVRATAQLAFAEQR